MVTVKKFQGIELTLEHGVVIRAEKFGKGKFTTAYRDGQDVYLLSIEDVCKEAYHHYANATHSKHLPAIEWLDAYDVQTPHGERRVTIYKQPFYHALSAKAYPVAWSQFRVLEKFWYAALASSSPSKAWYYSDVLSNFNDRVEASTLPDELKEAVDHLQVAASTYGQSIAMEISKRNCRVDDEGRLILLDMLFDSNIFNRKSLNS